MNCEDYLILIDDLVEGELDGRFTQSVNSHLFNCRECAAQHSLLQKEKELYGHYFFDIEPPVDLVSKIESKLKPKDQEFQTVVVPPKGYLDRVTKISGFFRLSQTGAVAAGLILLFVINFFIVRLLTNHDNSAYETGNGTNFSESSTLGVEIKKNRPADFIAETATNDDRILSKVRQAPVFSASSKTSKRPGKAIANLKAKSADAARNKNAVSVKSLFSDERPEGLKLQKLETETVRQVEKIELLLRSFRNAEAALDDETYNVAYEKQQARKLLERNVRLKQTAENYGSLYTVELLIKAEPLLLEIANLENLASTQKVLEIRERLRNKNLIVSLQAY